MSRELVNRLRKNREFKLPVGKFVYIARRPTDEEFVRINRGDDSMFQVAATFVIGWEKMTVDDIVPGDGGSDPVPFSPELWREFLADRPDLWEAIARPILDSYIAHTADVRERAKNSEPG